MRIPGLKTTKAYSNWMQARVLGGAIILGYHSVAAVKGDEYDICIRPEHFAEHMEVVRKYTHPVSFAKLAMHLKSNTLPAGTVAVTFDDGYADNLYQAKPVLEEFDIPATVFVCTGYTGKKFWWDEMERLVMLSRANLRTLHVQAGSKSFDWDQFVRGLEKEGARSAYTRRHFHHAHYYFLLPLDLEERDNAMDSIRSWAGLPANEPEGRVP